MSENRDAAAIAFEDQLSAALRESEAQHRMATLGWPTVEQISEPPYVRVMVNRLREDLDAGRIRRCRHLRSPTPTWLFANAPTRLLCTRCAGLLAKMMEPEDLNMCWPEGHETAEPIGVISNVESEIPLLCWYSVCREHQAAELDSEPPE